MCGLAGIFQYDPNEQVAESALRAMAQRMIHRGPDDEGVFRERNVGFAFRRLAIIDLTPNGHQPMSSADGSISVVVNGEIYNFPELRAELVKAGYQFRGNSDTEVLLNAYHHYGDACVEKLNGMFAFAIWDARQGSVLLGRDRLGKKPLYFSDNGRSMVFASEMKAIFAIPGIPRDINRSAVDEYFAFGYVGGNRTIYSTVRQLEPASVMKITTGGTTVRKYWKPEPRVMPGLTEDDAASSVKQLLEDAVRIRLMSDVPIGAFLSGGIDSSLVVALMSKLSSRPVRTFSVGFHEEEFNEADEARVVARFLGTHHSEEIVDPDYAGLIEPILLTFDQPFGDSSALPTYIVSKMTRKHVTVALSGDGGDEIFGGYDLYSIAMRERRFDAIPSLGKRLLHAFASIYPETLRGGNVLRRASLTGIERRYVDRFQIMNGNERACLLTPAVREGLDPELVFDTRLSQFSSTRDCDPLLRLQLNDLYHYLPHDILVKVDRMSMLNSLESRAPFLDYRVVELGLGLPSALKLKAGVGKHILRKIVEDMLPPEVSRRPKRGFAIPLKRWFMKDLRDFAHDRIFSRAMIESGIIDVAYAEKLFNLHLHGLRDKSRALWLLLAFAIWLDGENSPAAGTTSWTSTGS
jgi:asparagine synthase (glutamine-hydrolysing)